MTTLLFWIILILFALSTLLTIYFKRAPHGWIQFRTGLVLKFMPSLDAQPVVPLRHSLEAFVKKQFPKIVKSLPVDSVEDQKLPTRHGDITVRIYNCNDKNPTHNIVFIHGGGWAVGSIDTYEEICRRLAIESNLPVISLDYSLAPEYKFPHAHEECIDAVEWIVKNATQWGLNDLPVILIGDSAGGNLIISTTYGCNEETKKRIEKLIPVYPAVDGTRSDYFSIQNYGEHYYLTNKSMAQFTEALINHEDELKDLKLSPIHEQPVSTFPEMFVITAEFDPLRDQGEAFAAKLKSEGNEVISKRYKGTIHAFFGMKDFGSQGVKAISDIRNFINDLPIDDLRKI